MRILWNSVALHWQSLLSWCATTSRPQGSRIRSQCMVRIERILIRETDNELPNLKGCDDKKHRPSSCKECARAVLLLVCSNSDWMQRRIQQGARRTRSQ